MKPDVSKGVMLELASGDVAVFSDRDGGDQRRAHYREYQTWLKDRYAESGVG